MRAKFFLGFQSKFWKQSTLLEIFKFSLYIIIPLGASYIYADPNVMKSLILQLNLIHYPKANSKIPAGRELEAIILKEKQIIEKIDNDGN